MSQQLSSKQAEALFKRVRNQQAHTLLFSSLKARHSNKIMYTDWNTILDYIEIINKNIIKKLIPGDRTALKEKDSLEPFFYYELRVFVWALATLCHVCDLSSLAQLDLDDFRGIRDIFTHRSLTFIQYQTLCLIHDKQGETKTIWTESEIDFLREVVDKNIHGNSQWKQVSYKLYIKSDYKIYKNYQACREKWSNYLDPNVKRDDWTNEESLQLLQAVGKGTVKWNQIQNTLQGTRTQHQIRNHFNSLIKQYGPARDERKYSKMTQKQQDKIVKELIKRFKKKLQSKKEDIFDDKGDTNLRQDILQDIILTEQRTPKKVLDICDIFNDENEVYQEKIEILSQKLNQINYNDSESKLSSFNNLDEQQHEHELPSLNFPDHRMEEDSCDDQDHKRRKMESEQKNFGNKKNGLSTKSSNNQAMPVEIQVKQYQQVPGFETVKVYFNSDFEENNYARGYNYIDDVSMYWD